MYYFLGVTATVDGAARNPNLPSMSALYWIAVTLHVLAAMFWLGGMFFLGIIGAPVLRGVEPPAMRQSLFQALGLRFRRAGWIAIVVLVVTGVVNLHYRGLLRWSGALGDAAFWRTTLGHALAAKLAIVVVMVGASAVHDFVLGPAAGRAAPGSPEAARLRVRAAWLARANALVALALVVASVRLARGG